MRVFGLGTNKIMRDPFFKIFEKKFFPALSGGTAGTQLYTVYTRGATVALPPPRQLPSVLLDAVLRRRRSRRNFLPEQIKKEELSDLLYWSMGEYEDSQARATLRMHPSGGAKYPLECYVGIYEKGDINPGMYHYNISKHILEHLPFVSAENIRRCFHYDFAQTAPVVISFSYVHGRMQKKYGMLGYKLGILEGGHIGQNLYLVAESLHIGISAIGGMDYDVAHSEFCLGSEEHLFYHVILGYCAQ